VIGAAGGGGGGGGRSEWVFDVRGILLIADRKMFPMFHFSFEINTDHLIHQHRSSDPSTPII